MTVSISDMTVPAAKKEIIDEAEATVDRIAKNYRLKINLQIQEIIALAAVYKTEILRDNLVEQQTAQCGFNQLFRLCAVRPDSPALHLDLLVKGNRAVHIREKRLPQDLGFVDRSEGDNFLDLEIDFHVGKKQLKKILEKCINTHGATTTAETLDAIKNNGRAGRKDGRQSSARSFRPQGT